MKHFEKTLEIELAIFLTKYHAVNLNIFDFEKLIYMNSIIFE